MVRTWTWFGFNETLDSMSMASSTRFSQAMLCITLVEA